MRIESYKTVKVDELAHLVPHKAGSTFSQLWQIFYYTRLFKYIHRRQYVLIKKSFNKICTHEKLQDLCRLGYLTNSRPEVYCATNKVLPILREAGYNTELLPAMGTGTGDSNELHNTDVFIQATRLEHFHTLVYPHFGSLIPDALLIQLDNPNSQYKLTFLEVEAQKPKWEDYLSNKKDKYLRLAKNKEFCNYWKDTALTLGLPVPALETLKFNVTFVCSLKKDFGNGFTFLNTLQ